MRLKVLKYIKYLTCVLSVSGYINSGWIYKKGTKPKERNKILSLVEERCNVSSAQKTRTQATLETMSGANTLLRKRSEKLRKRSEELKERSQKSVSTAENQEARRTSRISQDYLLLCLLQQFKLTCNCFDLL